MNNESDSLRLLLQQTNRDSLDNINYKKLYKDSNCSKCGMALTRDKYKKDRTICKK